MLKMRTLAKNTINISIVIKNKDLIKHFINQCPSKIFIELEWSLKLKKKKNNSIKKIRLIIKEFTKKLFSNSNY